MKYSIIVAVSDNFVIGHNNQIPWHISEDLKLFKRLTIGNIIIMGRKTYESIGRPLPGRTIITISSSEKLRRELALLGVTVCSSFEEALSEAGKSAKQTDAEIFVAGGASVYTQAIDNADKLYLSRVRGEYDGDTFFPRFPEENWTLSERVEYSDFSFETYQRKE